MQEAEEVWKRGYFMAFTGIITYPSAGDLREVVKKCPLERIFVETDCPFLSPQKHRGERNEPAFVSSIAEEVIQIKKISERSLQKNIQQNLYSLFGIK